jgi:hypothetical protein
MIRAKLGMSVFAGSCFSDIASAAMIVACLRFSQKSFISPLRRRTHFIDLIRHKIETATYEYCTYSTSPFHPLFGYLEIPDCTGPSLRFFHQTNNQSPRAHTASSLLTIHFPSLPSFTHTRLSQTRMVAQ